jgi:hypothetical protein
MGIYHTADNLPSSVQKRMDQCMELVISLLFSAFSVASLAYTCLSLGKAL